MMIIIPQKNLIGMNAFAYTLMYISSMTIYIYFFLYESNGLGMNLPFYTFIYISYKQEGICYTLMYISSMTIYILWFLYSIRT